MEQMVSFCGLACHECGAFLATKADDDKKRKEVAKLWSEMYKSDIKSEDINCDGCLQDEGELFSHCAVCEIRKCGKDKGVVNCAHCPDYACEKLERFLQLVPEAKERLEKVRSKL